MRGFRLSGLALPLSLLFIVLFFAPHGAFAATIASQEDSSGPLSHYWNSDGFTGSYLVVDPVDGNPGYHIGSVFATDTTVIGIHIKVKFVTDGVLGKIPFIPTLHDESSNTPYTCAASGGYYRAFGSAADALSLQNELSFSDVEGTTSDLYFQCMLGFGHDQAHVGTSYRLSIYPVSTAHVKEVYVAMNASGTEPYYEISDDGVYGAVSGITAPVIIIPGILGSADKNGTWVLDPISHMYDDLIDTLVLNGYEKDKTLFTFPYDWHRSNVDTAIDLKQKIDQIKIACQCTKVDIVAHSMGGLIARQYIQSSAYMHDVRNLVFLGTPHLGAPKDYLMWEGGDIDISKEDAKFKYFLRIEAIKRGYPNLFQYVRNQPVPSVQELLPTYDYIKEAQPPIVPPTPYTVFDFLPISYPNLYPRNYFLENLNNNVSSLYNSGVNITNIVGELQGSTTITSLRLIPQSILSRQYWPDGYPQWFYEGIGDWGLERGPGDTTVPLYSSKFVNQHEQIVNTDHQHLPEKSSAQVFKALTGKSASTIVDGGLYIDAKELFIEILSPADIVVVAPNGERVGKDFSTNQELNEIPGAFYSGFLTDHEYITIPDPLSGEYRVFTQGTGSGGKYTLVTGVIGDSTSTEIFFTGQTIPGLITEHRIQIDPDHPENTVVRPADVFPPTILLNQPATTTFQHSEFLPINISITDTTGIATSTTVFDGRFIQASSTIDLFYEKLGQHTLHIFAQDLVGNATTSTTTFQVIATASSTISDINRVYALGWMSSKFKTSFLQQFNTTIKFQIITEVTQGKKVGRVVQFIDKILMKLLLVSLQLAKGSKDINQQGYQILVDDISWLISH